MPLYLLWLCSSVYLHCCLWSWSRGLFFCQLVYFLFLLPPLHSLTPTHAYFSTGEPQNFSVRVTPRAGYPLDLYILMDLSSSMRDDLDTVESLSSRLGENTTTVQGFISLQAFCIHVLHSIARWSPRTQLLVIWDLNLRYITAMNKLQHPWNCASVLLIMFFDSWAPCSLCLSASTIASITEDFRIGFGAFNEKPILPFVTK